jgi:putative oxidoreductase
MGFFATLHQLHDFALLLLRLGIAVVFWVHGLEKRAMWKMQPSAQMPTSMLSTLRLLAIVEPLGAVALTVGFLTQLAAAGFAIIMLGAIQLKAGKMHRKFKGDGGWELDYVLLTAAVTLVFTGAGQLALDHVFWGI